MNAETLIKIIETLIKTIADINNPETTGTVEGTIEQWRAVATLSEAIDAELAAQTWFLVGSLLSENDRKEDALSAYDKSVSLKSDNAVFYNERGATKALLGQLEGAISDYDKAIQCNPNNAETYFNRGKVKSEQGNYEGAIADFNEGLQRDPNNIEAYSNRGYAKSKLKRYKEAIDDYNKVLQNQPEDISAYMHRAIAKKSIGQHEAAIDDYDEIIRLNPKNAYAYKGKADAKISLGHTAEAKPNFHKALALIDLVLANFELANLKIADLLKKHDDLTYINDKRREMHSLAENFDRLRVLKTEIEQSLQALGDAE